jgi:4'-phosphopantetheinyl transferase EntD
MNIQDPPRTSSLEASRSDAPLAQTMRSPIWRTHIIRLGSLWHNAQTAWSVKNKFGHKS